MRRVAGRSVARGRGKAEAVWSLRPERGEKPQLRHADVLGLVNYGKVEGQVCAVCKLRSQATEYPGVGNIALRRQLREHTRKHRPEHGPLRLRQARFSA
jgi:hypothetical protein